MFSNDLTGRYIEIRKVKEQGSTISTFRKISHFIREHSSHIAMSSERDARKSSLNTIQGISNRTITGSTGFRAGPKGCNSFLVERFFRDGSRSIEFGYNPWKSRAITAKIDDSEQEI
jgi:hypothetical protein